jgi:hypothetical protein
VFAIEFDASQCSQNIAKRKPEQRVFGKEMDVQANGNFIS